MILRSGTGVSVAAHNVFRQIRVALFPSFCQDAPMRPLAILAFLEFTAEKDLFRLYPRCLVQAYLIYKPP